MFKNLGKKNKYILISLFSFPVLLLLLLLILKGCSGGKSSFASYEGKMKNACEKYVTNKNLVPKNEGGVVNVSLDDLVSNGYIDSPKQKLKDESCTGEVKVINNGVNIDEESSSHLLVIPNLVCKDYKTTHLIDKLKEDIVTEESGLYAVDDGFVYKGSKVNNYVKFFGKIYRIISIDKDGFLKLVKEDSEKDKVNWDYKYNTEIENSFGKNDYSDSNIIDVLYALYLKTSDKQKKHLIAYNVCYGNRSSEYVNIDKNYECSKILDKQFISLINTYDFAMASYDKDCVTIGAGACRNYNYLYDSLITTWTMNGDSDLSFKVFYYSQGSIISTRASNMQRYNIVIYLTGDEVYSKGNGSYENPYVIDD